MANWKWTCIVCEKCVKCMCYGDDDSGKLPNLQGGTIEIDFGYGSDFDDQNDMMSERVTHQGCICDSCYKEKKNAGIIRATVTKITRQIVTLSDDCRRMQ